MHCVILSFVVCSVLQYFSTLSNKRYNFRKNVKRKMSFQFSLNVLCELFLILRRTEQNMIKIVYWSSFKVSVILVIF